MFSTSAGSLIVIVVRDDEESHHADLDESDHVHEDHWSSSSSEDCLVMFLLFHCSIFFKCVLRSLRCRYFLTAA